MGKPNLESTFLMTLEVKLGAIILMGTRAAVSTLGGSFEGPKLKGRVVPGGGDWPVIRADGTMALNIHSVLETDDGASIYTSYTGRLVFPDSVAKLDHTARVALDPSEYYIRSLPTFETNGENYLWLNNIIAVGIGQLLEDGLRFSIYEIE